MSQLTKARLKFLREVAAGANYVVGTEVLNGSEFIMAEAMTTDGLLRHHRDERELRLVYRITDAGRAALANAQ